MSIQKKWLLTVGILTIGAALLAFGLPTQTVLILGLLLLCPLMMFFMMGGKHTQEGSSKRQPDGTSNTPSGGSDEPGK